MINGVHTCRQIAGPWNRLREIAAMEGPQVNNEEKRVIPNKNIRFNTRLPQKCRSIKGERAQTVHFWDPCQNRMSYN